MGNHHGSTNPCAELGLNGKTIGTAELTGLWDKYDADKSGKLDGKETVSFLQDFGVTMGRPISKSEAKSYYQTHNHGGSGLTKDQFFGLFVETAQEITKDPASGRLGMTASLLDHSGVSDVPTAEPAQPPISEMMEQPFMTEMPVMFETIDSDLAPQIHRLPPPTE